jgi:hypothetical protein
MIHSDLRTSCFSYRTSAHFKPLVFEGGEAAEVAAGESKKKEGEKPDEGQIERMNEDTKSKGHTMIEVGLRIPSSGRIENDNGIRDYAKRGGEATARMILGDPTKPYIALIFPLNVKYEPSITYPGKSQPDTLAATTTFSAGVGVEGGVPLGRYAALYVGGGLAGGVQVYKHQEVTPYQSLSSGTETTLLPSLFATGGLRVNPTDNWHIYASVKPTVSMTSGSGLDVLPFYVGTGFGF